jgi:hypothetical protein
MIHFPSIVSVRGLDSFIQLQLTRESEIILGSAESGNGFDGCMKDLRLKGETLPHNKSNNVAMVTKYKSKCVFVVNAFSGLRQ